jgi:hypothetical protein
LIGNLLGGGRVIVVDFFMPFLFFRRERTFSCAPSRLIGGIPCADAFAVIRASAPASNMSRLNPDWASFFARITLQRLINYFFFRLRFLLA